MQPPIASTNYKAPTQQWHRQEFFLEILSLEKMADTVSPPSPSKPLLTPSYCGFKVTFIVHRIMEKLTLKVQTLFTKNLSKESKGRVGDMVSPRSPY